MSAVRWSSLLAAGVLASSACEGGDAVGPVDPIEALPRQLTVEEQAVIRNANAFGLDLLERVHEGEDGPNLFLSPLSASMALGMVMNGADGETWQEMRDALRFDGLSEDDINGAYRGLLDLLLDLDPRVMVRIGNSVWSRQGFPFEDAFYSRVRDHFDAEVGELDFGNPAAVDIINGWASDATNGRIEKVLDAIGPQHIMFLLNALYFKGTWTRQFDPDETRPSPFTRADGSRVDVPMMRLPPGDGVLSTWTQDYQAIELAYGGGAYAMVVVLPGQGRTLPELVGALDAQAWDALLTGLDSTRIEVRMPRFRLEYETLLNEPLQDLGMKRAFCDTTSDFTRLTPVPDVYVEFVKQNTFVEVNEEGTEAAAVTTVGMGLTSAPPSFVADRPFLFVIRERLSGTILFIGTIGDPTRQDSEPVTMPAGPSCP